MEGLQEGERTLIQPDCPPLAPPTCGNHFTGAKVCPSGGAEVLHMLQPVDKVSSVRLLPNRCRERMGYSPAMASKSSRR